MKKYGWLMGIFVSLSILSIFLFYPHKKSAQESWIETVATIHVEEKGNDGFEYAITYYVTKGEVVNAKGEKIQGPIVQYALSQKEPIEGQKVRMKYLRDEPVIFEFLEPIQYKKV